MSELMNQVKNFHSGSSICQLKVGESVRSVMAWEAQQLTQQNHGRIPPPLQKETQVNPSIPGDFLRDHKADFV